MMEKWPQLRNLIFQSFIVCILSILAFEVAARIFLPKQIAAERASFFGDGRYGFITRGALANQNGYMNFRPNSTIRIVAYYPTAKGKVTLEYDCKYRSDRTRLRFQRNRL